MPRFLFGLAVLAGAALLAHSAAPRHLRADDKPKEKEKDADKAPAAAGNWKLSLPTNKGEVIVLVALAEKDGKWSGEVLDATRNLGEQLVVSKASVDGDVVKFTLGTKDEPVLTFDGLVSKDRKKLNGSLALGGQARVTTLLPSKLKKFDDSFSLSREFLSQVEDGAELFEYAIDVLGEAAAKKLPPDEARGIVERVNKAAAAYGTRWEREFALRLIDTLSAQDNLTDLAIAQAKRAERMLDDDAPVATRMAVVQALARTLTKAGKPDDAKAYTAQLTKLEARDFAEYSKAHPPFKVEPFAGRKGKGDRAAVVEVFTGAECVPCAGPEAAVAGLAKAYPPTEVIHLSYHIHAPRPDPLTAPDGFERAKYYAEELELTPGVLISGKLAMEGGGPPSASEKFYKRFRGAIDDLVEKPAGVKLALTVAKGEKGAFTAKAVVSDLEKPGEKVALRFVLAEERVRFAGANGVRYHTMVVRAMPGGPKGFPLAKKEREQTVTIDPEALKGELAKYLDEFAKNEAPFPRSDRPLALRNLKLVALVQNDATKEILQAVQVDIP
jgi:hypothetical protein